MILDAIQNIIGVYEPSANGGVNFAYVFAGTVFCIVLYSALRILGSVIGK